MKEDTLSERNGSSQRKIRRSEVLQKKNWIFIIIMTSYK